MFKRLVKSFPLTFRLIFWNLNNKTMSDLKTSHGWQGAITPGWWNGNDPNKERLKKWQRQSDNGKDIESLPCAATVHNLNYELKAHCIYRHAHMLGCYHCERQEDLRALWQAVRLYGDYVGLDAVQVLHIIHRWVVKIPSSYFRLTLRLRNIDFDKIMIYTSILVYWIIGIMETVLRH